MTNDDWTSDLGSLAVLRPVISPLHWTVISTASADAAAGANLAKHVDDVVVQ
jgi:hypothetical protein